MGLAEGLELASVGLEKGTKIMMKRWTWLFAAALAMSGAGCSNSPVASSPKGAAGGGNASSPTAAPQPAPAPAPPPRTNDPNEILSVLSVEHQVDVASQRDGVVVSLTKDEGSIVKAGEILGQLDDRSLQMELVKARDDLQVAQNNVKYKEAELREKGAAYKRQQQLRALGLSSEADLEAADFASKAAEYDMHGWEALTESSNAEIHRIEIETDQTRLRSPFPGVVARRYVREGQSVAKGEKCFRVSQMAPLLVQFQVPESSSRRPERGANVNLALVGDSKRLLSARIVKVSPTVDPSSDSYAVTAQLTGATIADLRPGMAVRISWMPPAQPAPAKP
jgi:RND family efflux transporter MFP subunit